MLKLDTEDPINNFICGISSDPREFNIYRLYSTLPFNIYRLYSTLPFNIYRLYSTLPFNIYRLYYTLHLIYMVQQTKLHIINISRRIYVAKLSCKVFSDYNFFNKPKCKK